MQSYKMYFLQILKLIISGLKLAQKGIRISDRKIRAVKILQRRLTLNFCNGF